jgi:hypothetical protein
LRTTPRCLSLAFAGLLCATAAGADSFGFTNITHNNLTDAAAGAGQLFVDVTAEGGSQVRFAFRNLGPSAMSICDVYFQGGVISGIASIVNGPGVDFSEIASPPDLPGGKDITPKFEATFSADSNPPAQPNGVNPGETLAIVFNLLPAKTFSDVILSLNTDRLRVGIHVQGYASGGSESYVNGDRIPVAEPGLLSVGLAGLAGLAVIRRRSRYLSPPMR